MTIPSRPPSVEEVQALAGYCRAFSSGPMNRIAEMLDAFAARLAQNVQETERLADLRKAQDALDEIERRIDNGLNDVLKAVRALLDARQVP